MKRKRKALFLASTAVTIVIIIVGITLFAQTPSTAQEASIPEELPTEGTPPNLLVIPEVPLGTLAIILACFFALIISQMKPKAKLQ